MNVTIDSESETEGVPEIDYTNPELAINSDAIYSANNETIPLIITNPTNTIQSFITPKIRMNKTFIYYTVFDEKI